MWRVKPGGPGGSVLHKHCPLQLSVLLRGHQQSPGMGIRRERTGVPYAPISTVPTLPLCNSCDGFSFCPQTVQHSWRVGRVMREEQLSHGQFQSQNGLL